MLLYIGLTYIHQFMVSHLQRIHNVLVEAEANRRAGKDIKSMKLAITANISDEEKQQIETQVQKIKLDAMTALSKEMKEKAIVMYKQVEKKVRDDYDKMMSEIIEIQKKRDEMILEGLNLKQENEFARVTTHTYIHNTHIYMTSSLCIYNCICI